MTEQSSILLEKDPASGIAILTLNRPNKLNAFNREMIQLWIEALHAIESDKEVRGLIVTGAGKAFCAGGDADELDVLINMSPAQRKEFLWREVHQIPLLLQQIDVPVIAAINGTARGAGLDMALMCDLRVMDETAVVAESYIHMGIMPGDGGAWFLPRITGTATALEMIWTGEDIDAQTALRCGLANRIASQGEALTKALDLAQRIARHPLDAIKYSKRAVYQGMTLSLHAHLDATSSHMAVLQGTEAFISRVNQFLDRSRKRKRD